MLEHYLTSNSIPFEVASNASTLDEMHDDITRSCMPLGIWLPRKQLDEPALYKLIRLKGIDLGWSKGFDHSRFHLRSRPTVRQFISLNGTAQLTCRGATFDFSAAYSRVIPANHDHIMAYGAGFRSLMLNIDEAVLLRKFRAIVGSETMTPDFSRSIDMKHPRTRAMMRSIQFAFQELEAGGYQTPDLIRAEISELMILSFLLATERHLQDEAAAKQTISDPQLRRVTDYIEVNWREPLDIEKLAVVAGTSARTVFRAFKRQYCETPAQFLRRTRLLQAKKLLNHARPDDSVIGIALACGFANAGHFAQHYQSLFGEKPNETLRAGLRRRG